MGRQRRSSIPRKSEVANSAGLYVEVLDVEGVPFDEFPAGLDVFAHEGGEDLLAGGDVFQPYLE